MNILKRLFRFVHISSFIDVLHNHPLIYKGRSIARVGESGCGKTTIKLSLLKLLPAESRIVSGKITYYGTDLLSLSEAQMSEYPWNRQTSPR